MQLVESHFSYAAFGDMPCKASGHQKYVPMNTRDNGEHLQVSVAHNFHKLQNEQEALTVQPELLEHERHAVWDFSFYNPQVGAFFLF